MKRAITVLIITSCLAPGCQSPDEPSSSAPGPGDTTTGVTTAQLEAIAEEGQGERYAPVPQSLHRLSRSFPIRFAG